MHPLDPLSSAEIDTVAKATRAWAADQGLGALRFNVVALQVWVISKGRGPAGKSHVGGLLLSMAQYPLGPQI